MLAGVFAAAWFAALWYAAPLFVEDREDLAERLRAVLAQGVALGLVLGLAHAFYAPVLAIATLVLVVVRRVRIPHRLPPDYRSGRGATGLGTMADVSEENALGSLFDRFGLGLVVAAVVAASWPPLVRPLLEGDSLWYHLPNAAAWVQTGSLWDTPTRYWWFPGGSELFAAGLMLVSGTFSLGMAGMAALALLGVRLWSWGRRLGLSSCAAGCASAATLATLTFGLQAGNLLNDVWLGAFFVEALYAGKRGRNMAVPLAVCALVKPYGFVLAIIAALATRRLDRGVVFGAIPLLVWVVRDAILWRSALIAPSSTYVPLNGTTIIGNGLPAFGELVLALVHDSPWMLALGVAPIFGLLLRRQRAVSAAALLVMAVFVCLPFSYRNDLAQLTTGESLRYAIPGFAAGAIALMAVVSELSWVVAVFGAVAFAFGIRRIIHIFWIDPNTHGVYWIALLALVLALLPSTRARTFVVAAVVAIAFAGTNQLAGRYATARYNEWLGTNTQFFDWIARVKPARLVVSDFAPGSIVVVSPSTRVYDVIDPAPCDEARQVGAGLAFLRTPAADKTIYPNAVKQFANCGSVLYEDALVRVLQGGS